MPEKLALLYLSVDRGLRDGSALRYQHNEQ